MTLPEPLVRSLCGAAIALVAVSCASAQSIATDFEQISLTRTQCYGRCPVYSVQIQADGSVVYTGNMYVDALGTHTATVSPQDLELLKLELRASRFQEFRSSYASEEDGCTALRTDLPSLIITVRIGSSERSVNYYKGCKGPDEVLERVKQLAAAIDKVAGTNQWVGQR